MRLTKKLLKFLSRVYDKDPKPFLALRLNYAGTMSWRIEDARLTTTVVGGPGGNLSVDLTQYTVAGLVNYLAAQPGYSIPYADSGELSMLGARVLLDGANTPAASNGDHLYGYTNVLWAYYEAFARELMAARVAIVEMLKQLSTKTASDVWLDELGAMYGVPRLASELDEQYGPRIIAEVLRPRGNNVAMEMALKAYTGQDTKVTDAIAWTASYPLYDGVIDHDGSEDYNSAADPIYGLFDVEYGYDLLNGGDFASFQANVIALIDRIRDAGTHLRALVLGGSQLEDTLTAPTEDAEFIAQPLLEDTADAPTEESTLSGEILGMDDYLTQETEAETVVERYALTYSGLRTFNGGAPHMGGGFVSSPAPKLVMDLLRRFMSVNGASAAVATALTLASGVNAAVVGPDGVLAPLTRTNLLTRSAEFDHADWTKTATTISANASADPKGGALADQVTSSSGFAAANVARSVTVADDTALRTFSVYGKTGTLQAIRLRMAYIGGATPVAGSVDCNLVTGQALVAETPATFGSETLAGGWSRFWVTMANNKTGNTTLALQIYAGDWLHLLPGDFYLFGAQLEAGLVGAYIATTTAAATVTDSAPFEFDPASRQPTGLLTEAAGTNALRNNTMAGTVPGSAVAMPTYWTWDFHASQNFQVLGSGMENGVDYLDLRIWATADSRGYLAVMPDHYWGAGISAGSGETWTHSVFLKRLAGTIPGVQDMRLRAFTVGAAYLGEATASIAFAGPGANLLQERKSVTYANTPATTGGLAPLLVFGSLPGAYDFTIRIGLPQVEQSPVASSPVRTGAGAVTRSARDASLSGADFAAVYDAAAGTIVVDCIPIRGGRVQLDDGTADNRLILAVNPTTTDVYVQAVVGGVAAASLSLGSVAAGQRLRLALSWAAGGYTVSRDGAAPAALSSALPAGVSALRAVGAGLLRECYLIPGVFTAGELQRLSALS